MRKNAGSGSCPCVVRVRCYAVGVVIAKTPGDLSEPIESQFGYHIIRLEERKPKGPQPYAEVRGQLMSDARAALLNESRTQKAISLNKEFVFDQSAFEALGKPTTP